MYLPNSAWNCEKKWIATKIVFLKSPELIRNVVVIPRDLFNVVVNYNKEYSCLLCIINQWSIFCTDSGRDFSVASSGCNDSENGFLGQKM